VGPFVAAGLHAHAVGVASDEVFAACVAAGCDGLQGPCPGLPALKQPSSIELGAMATASELLAPDLDFERLQALIARDLELGYRLLRYVNAAFFSRPREIGTVREAIALLGERMTRRWALVVALAGGGPRPDGLLDDALVRARTMELLAAGVPGLIADHAFTVGLFSMLPSLVDRPMERALDGLGLPAEIEAALLDGHPPYGALLDRIICHLDGAVSAPPVREPVGLERLDGHSGEGPAGAAIGLERLEGAYREALGWVQSRRNAVAESA
jgi:EAL and modified HD-GYP domain-containing signal transduction protein